MIQLDIFGIVKFWLSLAAAVSGVLKNVAPLLARSALNAINDCVFCIERSELLC